MLPTNAPATIPHLEGKFMLTMRNARGKSVASPVLEGRKSVKRVKGAAILRTAELVSQNVNLRVSSSNEWCHSCYLIGLRFTCIIGRPVRLPHRNMDPKQNTRMQVQ